MCKSSPAVPPLCDTTNRKIALFVVPDAAPLTTNDADVCVDILSCVGTCLCDFGGFRYQGGA